MVDLCDSHGRCVGVCGESRAPGERCIPSGRDRCLENAHDTIGSAGV
jgi:hypothetical protein